MGGGSPGASSATLAAAALAPSVGRVIRVRPGMEETERDRAGLARPRTIMTALYHSDC